MLRPDRCLGRRETPPAPAQMSDSCVLKTSSSCFPGPFPSTFKVSFQSKLLLTPPATTLIIFLLDSCRCLLESHPLWALALPKFHFLKPAPRAAPLSFASAWTQVLRCNFSNLVCYSPLAPVEVSSLTPHFPYSFLPLCLCTLGNEFPFPCPLLGQSYFHEAPLTSPTRRTTSYFARWLFMCACWSVTGE